MKKLVCVLLCLCLLFILAAYSEVRAADSTLADRAQTIADTIVSDYGSTGLQYAIIDSGRIILSGSSGVSNKTKNRAVTKENIFGIGSTSKMFITAAAMTLVDKGLLDIDAPLTRYLPEFKMADKRCQKITARMLMNHSSGIYGSSFSDSFLFDDADTTAHDMLLERLAHQSLKADPGQMSEYCNDGFTLLEILVERISGISFTEFLAKNFCQPLGLTHTKTPQDDFDRAQMAKAYKPLYDGALPNDTVNVLGTGGLYSTAEELCRFAEVLMGNKPEILSEASAALMLNEEYKKGMWPEDNAENLAGFGLGWDTVHCFPFGDYGIQSAGKSGGTLIFNSYLIVLPQHDIAMAVVSSGGSASIDYAFAATVLQELLLKKGIIKQISPLRTFNPPVPAKMPEKLAAYSGLYANNSTQSQLKVEDGVLTVASKDGETKYIYTGNNIFSSEDGSAAAQFVQPADGKTYLQIKRYMTLPGVGQAVKCSFDCQRLEPAGISGAVLDAWNGRAGMKYYLVSEKPTSQAYFMDTPALQLRQSSDFATGYAEVGIKITTENLAVNTLKFRDVTDLSFFTKDGVEYLRASSLLYMREDAIPALTCDTAEGIIGADGCTKYYRINADTAGKTITISTPPGAAYAVYDEKDICVNFTTVSHNYTTVLPANGKIAFIGKAGSVFGIRLR